MAVILVVEDEATVLALADSYLQEQGHKTLSASTADEAMALIDGDETIDLLFTDIGLKEDLSAGIGLAKRAIERRTGLKVLYTTGQMVTDGMRAMFVEGSAMLEKPYTVDQLSTTLVAHFSITPGSPR